MTDQPHPKYCPMCGKEHPPLLVDNRKPYYLVGYRGVWGEASMRCKECHRDVVIYIEVKEEAND